MPRAPTPAQAAFAAGWTSVKKSDPALWARVLADVKAEPGRWAAWKAIKADRLYKEKGGRFE